MPLTTVSETYVPCIGYSLTVGGSAVAEIADGGFDHQADTDEMTNKSDGGGYSDVKTTEKATIDATASWKNGSTPDLVVGAIYPVVISGGSGNPYLSCNARLNSAGAPVLGAKKGVKVQYKFTSQGAVNRTGP